MQTQTQTHTERTHSDSRHRPGSITHITFGFSHCPLTGTFRPDRLAAICARFDVDQKAALENIFFVRARSSKHLKELLDELEGGMLRKHVSTRAAPTPLPSRQHSRLHSCMSWVVTCCSLSVACQLRNHDPTHSHGPARGIGPIG
jgi:hypothetical protein